MPVRERALHARQDARGPHVRILVEALADRQAQPPQRHVVGHFPASHRAEQDRVEFLQPLEAARRDVVPVLRVEVRAPRETLHLEAEPAVGGGERLEHVETRGDHLGTDSIAADGGQLVDAHVVLLALYGQIVRQLVRWRFQDVIAGAHKARRSSAGMRPT